MKLSPADVRNVYHYEDGKLVGVEMRHKDGTSSGVQKTLDDADRALREKLRTT